MIDKMKDIHRGATCSDGSFGDNVRCERRRARRRDVLLHHAGHPFPPTSMHLMNGGERVAESDFYVLFPRRIFLGRRSSSSWRGSMDGGTD